MDLFSQQRRTGPPAALSVSRLLRKMRGLLEAGIGEVWVEGEVSNLKKQASGHWYFTLKDEDAQIQCAMFGAARKTGSAVLRDGAQARVFAEAGVYEARGQLQLVVLKAEDAGLGDLQARFEALKRKLQAEDLFDTARKRPLPVFPRVVGIVTSDTGAVIRDILHVLRRRAPWIQPVLVPTRVQGKGAEHDIARAIAWLGSGETPGAPPCDVIIVGRGGGSLEDLWCFNEEVVARAIAACPVPVVSAVGHETDFTIADFVADVRAPTPSAAAEIVAPDAAELLARLGQYQVRLSRALDQTLRRARVHLDGLRRSLLTRDGEKLLREPMMLADILRARLDQALSRAAERAAIRFASLHQRHQAQHPARVLAGRLDELARQRGRLGQAAAENLRRHRTHLASLREMFRTLGPESAFRRGFSITLDPAGRAVRSIAGLVAGTPLRTLFADGEAFSEVRGTAGRPE